MSLLPRCCARIPRGSHSLFSLLAFLSLLTLQQHLAEGGPSAILPVTELRCVCLTVTPRINPKMIANLEVIAAGPQCPRVEVIAKLKNQKEICLDPEAPLMKKIIQKILNRLGPTSSCTRASPLQNLQVLLLLPFIITVLVHTTVGQSGDVDPYIELDCRCENIVSGIEVDNISCVNVFRPRLHCAKVEVIATHKDGNKTCLDPNAPAIRKTVMKILDGR
ncbi:hypothetical protein STEG23_006072 [Scotinomys teguina]